MRLASRLLILIFLVNVLGVAAVQVSSDEHDVSSSYSHDDSPGKGGSSPCSHPCHLGFHFMGLPAMRLPQVGVENAAQVSAAVVIVRSTSPSSPFHPPRALV